MGGPREQFRVTVDIKQLWVKKLKSLKGSFLCSGRV